MRALLSLLAHVAILLELSRSERVRARVHSLTVSHDDVSRLQQILLLMPSVIAVLLESDQYGLLSLCRYSVLLTSGGISRDSKHYIQCGRSSLTSDGTLKC
jgi:hypothetical protein